MINNNNEKSKNTYNTQYLEVKYIVHEGVKQYIPAMDAFNLMRLLNLIENGSFKGDAISLNTYLFLKLTLLEKELIALKSTNNSNNSNSNNNYSNPSYFQSNLNTLKNTSKKDIEREFHDYHQKRFHRYINNDFKNGTTINNNHKWKENNSNNKSKSVIDFNELNNKKKEGIPVTRDDEENNSNKSHEDNNNTYCRAFLNNNGGVNNPNGKFKSVKKHKHYNNNNNKELFTVPNSFYDSLS